MYHSTENVLSVTDLTGGKVNSKQKLGKGNISCRIVEDCRHSERKEKAGF